MENDTAEYVRLYTYDEVAAMFGVHRQTVWTWVRDGKLDVTNVGKRCPRFTFEALQKLIAGGMKPAQETKRQTKGA